MQQLRKGISLRVLKAPPGSSVAFFFSLALGLKSILLYQGK